MLSAKFKFICFAVFVSAAAILFIFPVLEGGAAGLESDTSSQAIKSYGQLSNVLSKCNTVNQVTEPTIKAPFSPAASLCINGALAVTDPTFNRMQTRSSAEGFGPSGTCTLSGSATAVHYDVYGFNLSGCAAFPTVVTVTMCGPAGCLPTANTDGVVILYRNVAAGNTLTANGGLPAVFNPASACTNARGLNDDLDTVEVATGGSSCNQTITSDCLALCAAPGGTSVGGFKRNLGSGRFTVVVGGFGNTTVGNYNLYVNAPAAGCAVALAPTDSTGNISGRVVTSTGQGIAKASLTVSGGGLGAPVTLRTNSFGYYNFPDLPMGGTYIVTVSAKMYTFTVSTRAVNLEENAADVDFVSEQ